MYEKKQIPFVMENDLLKKSLKILNSKKLGFLVIINKQKDLIGVFTDGDLKRLMQKKKSIYNLKIKSCMSINPYTVDKDMLASEVLTLMNKKKITNICVYDKKNKKKVVGVIHIHQLLKILK